MLRIIRERGSGEFDVDAVAGMRGQQQAAAADVSVHDAGLRQVP